MVIPSSASSLPVPEEAVAEFARTHKLPDPRGLVFPGGGGVDWEAVHADVRAIAAPVVAAELREWATAVVDELEGLNPEILGNLIRDLRNRADELDGGA